MKASVAADAIVETKKLYRDSLDSPQAWSWFRAVFYQPCQACQAEILVAT